MKIHINYCYTTLYEIKCFLYDTYNRHMMHYCLKGHRYLHACMLLLWYGKHEYKNETRCPQRE